VAETVKLVENSFRDVNIAFANELSMICDKLDINVWELIKLANRHPRVNILQPGPGVGGHCIAVDPWFIVSAAPENANLIRTAREVNDSKPEWVIQKVKLAVANYLMEHPDKTAKEVTIACYGLTFKSIIDDMRESPSLLIAEQLSIQHHGQILVIEPNISNLPICLKKAKLVTTEMAEQAHVHVMLVDHEEFKTSSTINGSLIDTRGIWR
jgi:UDP-N-acetyl-D-mannosaminuronic acid dehydrogenase